MGRAKLLGGVGPVQFLGGCVHSRPLIPTAGRGRAAGVRLCWGSHHPLPVSQGPPGSLLEASWGKRAGLTCQSAGTWAPDPRMNILEG